MPFSLIYDRLKQPPRAEVGKGNYVGGSRMDVCGKNGVLEKMRGAGASGGRKKVAEEAGFSCNNGFASKNARALSKTVVLCASIFLLTFKQGSKCQFSR